MGTAFVSSSQINSSPPSRRQQISNFLQQNNLRAWISWRPDELLMLCGYFPFWGASLLINFVEGEPILFVPQIEPRDHICGELRVEEYPWGDLKCGDPYAILASKVGAALGNAAVTAELTGMNPSAARSSLPIQAAEQIPMPEGFAEFVSGVAHKPNAECLANFARLYSRKTAEEIKAIRLANQVANVGLQAFFETLRPGIAEMEVAAAVESAIYRQIGRDGIFHSRAWAMVQSGPNSADAGRFNRSSARRIEEGDLVLIELATCVNGYWSDLSRTASVGSPKPEGASILETVRDAQQSAIDAVRPGISGGEIDAIARSKIAAKGFANYFTHHTGHQVGFRYHDPGFGLFPGESSLLESGMIMTIEPGVYIPEKRAGARIEDNVLVTESGYEILSLDSDNERRDSSGREPTS
jgi:Xaa-Pro dipeptidase